MAGCWMAGARFHSAVIGGFAVWLTAVIVGQEAGSPRPAPSHAVPSSAPHFETSENCVACHNSLTTSSGEDVSIGRAWRGSIMANSSRDPYWQASVRRETMDHPAHRQAIEDECATCHMPMARTVAKSKGAHGNVFAHLPIGRNDSDTARLAADGVSCTLCHQIHADRLGTPESFSGGFVIAPAPASGASIYGPFQVDTGRTRVMHSATGVRPAEGSHIQQSELCATCHTQYTRALGPGGEIVGSLPEQVPYLEWRHSAFRDERSCQSCHMPEVLEATPVASVLGEPRPGLSRHTFVGGNVFMLRMLTRYRTELGVDALPAELDANARATMKQLQSESATVTATASRPAATTLALDVSVRNLTGHKFPTGYPSRRSWLHVTVRDQTGRAIFESGEVQPSGAIAGNDNDVDATSYEPHYEEIRTPDQVQIYESVMVDRAGVVTTGLLSGTRFAKDNRLLPRGFEKSTAGGDIAVRGHAAADEDFNAEGDRVRYRIDIGRTVGPLEIDVVLRYQPISFRWAHNLESYAADEPRRFVTYFDAMSNESSFAVARTTLHVPYPDRVAGTLAHPLALTR